MSWIHHCNGHWLQRQCSRSKNGSCRSCCRKRIAPMGELVSLKSSLHIYFTFSTIDQVSQCFLFDVGPRTWPSLIPSMTQEWIFVQINLSVSQNGIFLNCPWGTNWIFQKFLSEAVSPQNPTFQRSIFNWKILNEPLCKLFFPRISMSRLLFECRQWL